MIKNKKLLLICSEDPRITNNGVSLALNTCFRASIEIFTYFDIYIHNKEKLIILDGNKESFCSFDELDLGKYDIIFLSPINIAFRYLFLYKKVRNTEVYSFLSDTYSYALFRNFILGLKFNYIFIKYLIKHPIVYIQEKYVDYFSKNIALQTSKDLKIFNRCYFSRKGFLFPNSPIFKKNEISNFNKRDGIGWIVSCSNDYYPQTKWVFDNIVVKVLNNNNNIRLHIHGRTSEILKTHIQLKYPDKFDIIYTKYFNDISSFYLNNKIILSPVYKGYGLINRTIEAMYYGCVAIGDPEAFNGISAAENGTNCFIAQNDIDFIDKIENAYVSKNMEIISNNASKAIKSDFKIENNIKAIKNIIKY
ncbi:hypothetical protein N9H31_00840 [bacterium]|nr:hypothetical protein [bacterium]